MEQYSVEPLPRLRILKNILCDVTQLAMPICREAGGPGTQPLAQLRPPPPARNVAHRDGDGLLLSDQHDQPLAACDAGAEKVRCSMAYAGVMPHR